MTRKMNSVLALLLALTLLLGACAAPAAEPKVQATEAVVATEAPAATEAPEPVAEPTEVPEPTAEPLDFQALFAEMVSGIADKGYAAVPAAKLSEELADQAPFLLDVRDPAEIEKNGYIAGAVNIPIKALTRNLDKLPGLDDPIVIYCASGHRGGMAVMGLRMLGYTNVLNLGAWKAAKMPVVGGALDWASIWTEYTKSMPEGFSAISAADLNTALVDQPIFLLDVREQAEVEEAGFIAGSVHLPIRELLKNLDKLPAQDAPIVIYCASGHRGGIAMAALQALGYTNVKNLGGGLGAWKKAELPVETDLALLVVPEAGEAPAVDAARLDDLVAAIAALPEGFAVVKPADLNTEMAENPPLVIDLRTDAEWE